MTYRLCTAKGLDPWIEVDGGQNGDNAALAIAAGSNALSRPSKHL
jgi:ribulose-phosphate 3-epimerase